MICKSFSHYIQLNTCKTFKDCSNKYTFQLNLTSAGGVSKTGTGERKTGELWNAEWVRMVQGSPLCVKLNGQTVQQFKNHISQCMTARIGF